MALLLKISIHTRMSHGSGTRLVFHGCRTASKLPVLLSLSHVIAAVPAIEVCGTTPRSPIPSGRTMYGFGMPCGAGIVGLLALLLEISIHTQGFNSYSRRRIMYDCT